MNRDQTLMDARARQVLEFRISAGQALFLVMVTLFPLAATASAQAQGAADCGAVDGALKGRIVHVAARMMRTDPVLPMIDQERIVSGSCYRQFHLSVPGTNKRFSLYLSPDKNFLTTTLWDVSVDPETVDMRMAARLQGESAALRAPSRGPEKADVTIVLFSDFQCPYCSAFAQIIDKYRSEHPDKIRIIFRNAPLSTHDWAMQAARTGICISQQDSGAFWKFHDYIFFKQRGVTAESLSPVTRDFLLETPEINSEQLSQCMASSASQTTLEQEMADMQSLEIHSTPVIFANGRRYEGFRDEASFLAAINSAAGADAKGR